MRKHELISMLKSLKEALEDLRDQIKKLSGQKIYMQVIRDRSIVLATMWFEEIQIILPRFSIDYYIIKQYSEHFEKLLKLAMKSGNRKTSYLGCINKILSEFENNLLIPIHKTAGEITSIAHLEKIQSCVSGDELDYLEEALGCARGGFFRASVILGWCAAVDRMQRTIERLGFKEFNEKAREMKNKTKGRFKRFNKEFNISTLSEFRATAFDKDMLWVLEYWELIDSNQHDRLLYCLILRNNAAHPGEAPITEENIASFYSDLRLIIFENPNFN